MYSERGLYFVTARTFQARMLLAPGPRVRDVLAGVLARSVSLTGVQLHGFVAVSNHVHFLVTAHGNSLSRFMQHFLGNAARKIARLTGWEERFWQRRFAMEPVLDDAASIGRLRYIIAHGVKEGLVRSPEEWTGLSCLSHLRTEQPTIERFTHWSRRKATGVAPSALWDPALDEETELRLTPLPCWAELSREQRQAHVSALVEGIVEAGAAAHATVLGAERAARVDPQTRPVRMKRSRQPRCHASSPHVFAAFRQTLSEWLAWYFAASRRYRSGELAAEFPPWSFKPGLAEFGPDPSLRSEAPSGSSSGDRGSRTAHLC